MQLEYDLREEDYIHFHLYHAAHSPSTKRSKLFFYLAPPVAGIIMILMPRTRVITQIIIGLLMPIVWLCIAPFYWRFIFQRRLKQMLQEGNNSHVFGRKTLSIAPAGIDAASETSESKVKWKAVNRVVTDEHCVYLYLNQALLPPTPPLIARTHENAFWKRCYSTGSRQPE